MYVPLEQYIYFSNLTSKWPLLARKKPHVRLRIYSNVTCQDIMNEPEEITSLKGNPIPRRLSVDYISFSAHVDYSQNSEFIEQVKAQHVVRNLLLLMFEGITRILMGAFRSLFMVSRLLWVGLRRPSRPDTRIGMKMLKSILLETLRPYN